jgi:hypothetical protein
MGKTSLFKQYEKTFRLSLSLYEKTFRLSLSFNVPSVPEFPEFHKANEGVFCKAADR